MVNYKKNEKKKLIKIRKVFEFIKTLSVFISLLGVCLLLIVMMLAPEIIENGNYYAGLFLSTTAVLFAPAVYFAEEWIKDSDREEK